MAETAKPPVANAKSKLRDEVWFIFSWFLTIAEDIVKTFVSIQNRHFTVLLQERIYFFAFQVAFEECLQIVSNRLTLPKSVPKSFRFCPHSSPQKS